MNQRIPEEDIIEADKSLQDFFDSLGPNDIYKQVFLEVLLEEIYGRRVDLSHAFKTEQSQAPPPASPNHYP
jgi:hypothetical protein